MAQIPPILVNYFVFKPKSISFTEPISWILKENLTMDDRFFAYADGLRYFRSLDNEWYPEEDEPLDLETRYWLYIDGLEYFQSL